MNEKSNEYQRPKPGVLKSNIFDLVGSKVGFQTLMGSYLGFDDKPHDPEIPWVSGLSLHYWHLPASEEPDYKINPRTGKIDDQYPHFEDELYLILEGTGTIKIGEVDHDVKKGSVIFVPAGEPHRFIKSTGLNILIFFGPDFSGRTVPSRRLVDEPKRD